ncbi:hypothetical protein PUN4_290004 [Paraburkholderia unamae]|uniref:hypothetical protein n=1 Tax=Paraburkholderia unamae TaxID=219649 RepID=UPI001CB64828|nr:hypothetical protein [Paraburkholderia unamae]CAG9257951.1 hypothetical protein PUN4_290004 [Paraburkholderia unamae]
MDTTINDREPHGVADAESFGKLRELMDRKERMIGAIRALPAQIEKAHAEALVLREQLTQADIAFEASADAAQEDSANAHKAKTDAILRAEATERRLRERQAAMEPAIGQIDDELVAEIGIVRSDADSLLESMMFALEPEVDRLVEALRPILAKVAVIRSAYPSGRSARYLCDAYLPSTGGGTELDPVSREYRAANRLKISAEQMVVARAELGPQLQPVKDALALATRFSHYSRLAVQLEPYVKKGVVLEYSGPSPVPPTEVAYRR